MADDRIPDHPSQNRPVAQSRKGLEPENGSERAGFYSSTRPPPMEGPTIYWIIAATFFGFVTLAFILLFPVYRFLHREEKQSEAWTQPALAERRRRALERAEQDAAAGDGVETEPPPGPGAPGEPPELK